MRILEKLLAVAAGVFGATGIILSAVAAHLEPSAALQNASLILLVHAPALIAILVAIRVRFLPRFGGVVGVIAIALASCASQKDTYDTSNPYGAPDAGAARPCFPRPMPPPSAQGVG